MTSGISSRTPEGSPNHCPTCGATICIEPSQPEGDAPCPNCGALLWFFHTSTGMRFCDAKAVAPLRARLSRIIHEKLGVNAEEFTSSTPFDREVGADSLAIVEMVMALEEEFGLTISDEEAEKIKTLGDAIDYIEKWKL